MDVLCPCCSGKTYGDCCAAFHLNRRHPADAEQLMRSRYSAYSLCNIDYIVATTVPSQQPLLDREALYQWAETTRWVGLEVISHQGVAGSDIHSKVEFNAFFADAEGTRTHHEHSLFVKIHEAWYFVDPTLPLPGMKKPCFCGSGKKFKHCCGGLL